MHDRIGPERPVSAPTAAETPTQRQPATAVAATGTTPTRRTGAERRRGGRHRRADQSQAQMVVVANRLPFDMEKLPDGSTKARQAPGGLVTALAPILSRRQGAWIGWPGSPDIDPRADHHRRAEPAPGHPVQRRGRQLLRGLLQRDALAAVPRRRRRIAVPPRLVGGLPAGQRAVRRGGRRARRAGRDRLGARLPAAAGPAVAAPAAAGRADRLLPAHPVPAGRAVHAAALADPDRPRPARRRPDRLPTARRRPQLRPAGQVAGRRGHHRRHHRVRRPDDPGRRLPDLDRLGRAVGAGRHPAHP